MINQKYGVVYTPHTLRKRNIWWLIFKNQVYSHFQSQKRGRLPQIEFP